MTRSLQERVVARVHAMNDGEQYQLAADT